MLSEASLAPLSQWIETKTAQAHERSMRLPGHPPVRRAVEDGPVPRLKWPNAGHRTDWRTSVRKSVGLAGIKDAPRESPSVYQAFPPGEGALQLLTVYPYLNQVPPKGDDAETKALKWQIAMDTLRERGWTITSLTLWSDGGAEEGTFHVALGSPCGVARSSSHARLSLQVSFVTATRPKAGL